MPDTGPSATLAGIAQDPAVILEYIRDGAEAQITHPDDECGVKAGGSCTPHGALLIMPGAFPPLPVPLPVNRRVPAPVVFGDGDEAGRVRQYGDGGCGHGGLALRRGRGPGLRLRRGHMLLPPGGIRAARFLSPPAPRPPVGRTLTAMPPAEPVAAWLLIPSDTTRQDGCWHCTRNPGYAHSHWQPVTAPRRPRPMGPVMRVLSRIWGEG